MPRAGLSADRVVDLGLRVLDEDGWAGMTLAAVAGRAGVAVPSLYKHVAGLPGLRRAVALVCLAELAEVLAAAQDRADPAGTVRAQAAAVRAYALAHPGRYAAVQGGPWSRGDAAWEESAADVVDALATPLLELGLPAERAVDAVRAVRALVHGFVTLETSGGFGLPDDVGASFSRAVDVLVTGLITG